MRRWLGGRWQGGRGERGGRGGGTRVKGRWRLEEGGGERRGLEWRGCEAVSKTFLGSTWRTHVVRAFLRGAGRGARKASSRAEMASVSLRFVRAAEAVQDAVGEDERDSPQGRERNAQLRDDAVGSETAAAFENVALDREGAGEELNATGEGVDRLDHAGLRAAQEGQ